MTRLINTCTAEFIDKMRLRTARKAYYYIQPRTSAVEQSQTCKRAKRHTELFTVEIGKRGSNSRIDT